MGVTYKLTDDIVQYILAAKQQDTSLSCRELVDRIETTFQRHVSKSSVHDVLKEANITSPRGRKAKNKFQIPESKIAQIFTKPLPADPVKPPKPKAEPKPGPIELVTAELIEPTPNLPSPPTEIAPHVRFFNEPEVSEDPIVLPPPERAQLPPLKSFEPAGQTTLGNILLTAVKSDLRLNSDQPADFNYAKVQVSAFKIDLEDGFSYFVDCRFRELSLEFKPIAAPIERGLEEMADLLLNNMQPIVIKRFIGKANAAFYDFVSSCELKSGKNISTIHVLNSKAQAIAHFGKVLSQKRNFIIGLDLETLQSQVLAEKIYTLPSSIFEDTIKYKTGHYRVGPTTLRSFVIVDGDRLTHAFVSNIKTSVPDGLLVRSYMERHGLEDVLRTYNNSGTDLEGDARNLLAEPVSQVDWDYIKIIPVEISQNEQFLFINCYIPTSYVYFSMLSESFAHINALAIKDSQKRQIFIKLSENVFSKTATENPAEF
jgi:hypothetical protein